MEKKPARGVNQGCSKFVLLPCCNWEQNTEPQLLKTVPEYEHELI